MDFTAFPILVTSQLTLRQPSIADQQAILALRSHPGINKYLDRVPSTTVEDAIHFIQNVNDSIKKQEALYWIITFTETQQVLGTISLFNYIKEESSIEIGYELMPAYQGKGIMQEAVRAVIRYAFHILQLQQIYAVTHHQNMASTKLLIKCSFIKSNQVLSQSPHLELYSLAAAL
jgi:[ribosomal protein S5]-alanine N-acetyltransferase